MDKKARCSTCQSGESGPCPAALERIYAIQGTKKKIDNDTITVGCPWFVNSAEHNYCFWNYAKTIEGEPVSDSDICDLLLIDQSTLESTCNSALEKLRDLKDTPELQELKEILLDKIAKTHQDNSVYLPDEYLNVAVEGATNEEEKDPEAELFSDDKKKKRKGFGMPIHRDGKKVDLYGITSKRKRDEIIAEKKKAHEAKKDNKK